MDDHQPNMRALRREWWAARIVGALGVMLLIAVVVLTAFSSPPENDSPPPAAPTAAASPPDTGDARRAEDIALCNAALSTAQAQGLLPAFAKRYGDVAKPTAVQGRYVCRAATDVAKYTIAFDLGCTRLGDPACIGLFTISQDGGGVLFQRH